MKGTVSRVELCESEPGSAPSLYGLRYVTETLWASVLSSRKWVSNRSRLRGCCRGNAHVERPGSGAWWDSESDLPAALLSVLLTTPKLLKLQKAET